MYIKKGLFLLGMVVMLLQIIACKNTGGGDIIDNIPEIVVYASGFCYDSNNTTVPGYWRNGIWHELTRVNSTKSGAGNKIIVHNNIVYVAGFSMDDDSNYRPGFWQDSSWHFLPMEAPYVAGMASDIFINGTDLYVSGDIRPTNNFGTPVPGYWKNNIWNALPAPDGSTNGTLRSFAKSIISYNSSVVAAGYGIFDATNIYQVGYWTDGTWNGCAMPDSAISNVANNSSVLAVLNSDIYVAGYYGDSTSIMNPGYWKNGSLVPLSELDDSKGGRVNSIRIDGSDVYCAGIAVDSDSILHPGYWLNNIWHGLTSLSTSQSGIYAMVITDSVYIGGYSGNNGKLIPGYWKDGVWNELSQILSNGGMVFSLFITAE